MGDPTFDPDEARRASERERALQDLRHSVATSHDISPTDRDVLLTGTDEAALTAQAQRLVELGLTQDQPVKLGNLAPREGRTVESPRPEGDIHDFVRELFDNDY